MIDHADRLARSVPSASSFAAVGPLEAPLQGPGLARDDVSIALQLHVGFEGRSGSRLRAMAIIFFPSGFREANREELSGTCEEAYTSWNRSHFPSKLLRIAALPDPERRAELFGQADGVARRLSSPWLHERVARSRDSPNP